MKNSIFGLLIIGILAHGILDAEDNTVENQPTPKNLTYKKIEAEKYSLFQLLTAFGAGSCAGYLKQKTKYLPRVFAPLGLALFGVATIAPKYTENCGRGIGSGLYNTIMNRIEATGKAIEKSIANWEKRSAQKTTPTAKPIIPQQQNNK